MLMRMMMYWQRLRSNLHNYIFNNLIYRSAHYYYYDYEVYINLIASFF